jgi:penicillin-binding protein 1C
MEGVSGVSGAGPLLHRAVMLTAQRYPAGALPTPADVGLVAADVCRLSGMRATAACPAIREWFIAGTEPVETDTWMRNGRVTLPAEYAEWASSGNEMFVAAEGAGELGFGGIGADAVPSDVTTAEMAMGSNPTSRTLRADRPEPRGFRIVAPLDGDVYRVPPGVPNSYATIPLLAAGSRGAVRWFVDDVPFEGARWRLTRGTHVIRAESATGVSSVRIRVD